MKRVRFSERTVSQQCLFIPDGQNNFFFFNLLPFPRLLPRHRAKQDSKWWVMIFLNFPLLKVSIKVIIKTGVISLVVINFRLGHSIPTLDFKWGKDMLSVQSHVKWRMCPHLIPCWVRIFLRLTTCWVSLWVKPNTFLY